MIDLAMLESAAQEQHKGPSNDQLAELSALARKQLRCERGVERAERLLELRQAALAKVSQLDIPDAMAAIGMTQYAIEGGFKVEVDDQYYANIPSQDTDKPELLQRRAECFNWLRTNNHGSLIRNEIVINTGKGEEAQAQRVINGLAKAGIPYRNTESVHAQTLKAFVKEQMKKQESVDPNDTNRPTFPVNTFGVHKKRVAKIKPAKSR